MREDTDTWDRLPDGTPLWPDFVRDGRIIYGFTGRYIEHPTRASVPEHAELYMVEE